MITVPGPCFGTALVTDTLSGISIVPVAPSSVMAVMIPRFAAPVVRISSPDAKLVVWPSYVNL